MSCRRAHEIDLAAFAADPGGPEWEAFRAHYAGCPDCARAVAPWARLRGALADLAEGGGAAESGHPGDAELLALAVEPARLSVARREALEAHVAACAPCRTELAVVRDFDFAALGVGAAAPVREAGPGLGERIAGWLGGLLGPLRQPAFAAAAGAILAVVVAFGVGIWRASPGEAPVPPPVARQEPAPEVSVPGPGEPLREPGAAPRSTELARETEPGPETPAAETPAQPDAAEREMPRVPTEPTAPRALAREEPSEPPADPVTPEPAPSPPPRVVAEAPPPPEPPREPTAPAEPADIASLLPDEPPAYRPRVALAGGSLEAVRSGAATAVRAAGEELPAIRALGPEHVGATHRASPTLYWHLAERSDVPVELTLIADTAVEPLVEVRMEPPVAAGLHPLSLAERGVELRPGETYAWFATLVPDPERRDRDAVSRAVLRYAPAPPDLERRLEAGGPAQRAHLLAEAGYWVDAFAASARLAREAPGSERAAAHRRALLEQVGLGDVAAALTR